MFYDIFENNKLFNNLIQLLSNNQYSREGVNLTLHSETGNFTWVGENISLLPALKC